MAQDKRWRCVLGMQVERSFVLTQVRVDGSGGRLSNAWERAPWQGTARRKAG